MKLGKGGSERGANRVGGWGSDTEWILEFQLVQHKKRSSFSRCISTYSARDKMLFSS